MKNKILIMLTLLVIISCGKKVEDCPSSKIDRSSITFIMGEDSPGKSYFTWAEEYFRWDRNERTDRLIKSCRNFEDMYDFIRTQTPDNGLPWGTINVVLHGNVWRGLSIKLYHDGPRCTAKNMLAASEGNMFEKIDSVHLDSCSTINFYGCGIGKNPVLVHSIDSIFTLKNGDKPTIHTSPDYVIFTSGSNGEVPMKLQASYWPYIFKRGYRPGNITIANVLRKSFPSADIPWRTALENEEYDSLYSQSFHIPITHTVVYGDDKERPSVSSSQLQMQWVRNQNAIQEQLEEAEIPLEKFTWTVYPFQKEMVDGSKKPAIKAIGMTTILCVLKPEV